MTEQTIFALSSGRPPAGIAVVRISGLKAFEAGQALAGSLPELRTAAVRRLHDPASGELLDEALVLRFAAPASATGEDVVEFHCHGGRAVVDAVVQALQALPGLREAEPGEFTRRAFANGRMDLTEAEGLADLLEAETQSQRRAALAMADGGLRRQIAQWQHELLRLSAMAERAIDYDDDDEQLDPALAAGCEMVADDLDRWLEQPRAEPLKQGVRVVLAGPPNAGKSSLINALAGEDRAIVTPVPGTTRDVVEVPISLGGIPLLLTDTAGLRSSDDPVESIGVERANRMIAEADILLWLGDATHPPEHSRLVLLSPKSDLGNQVPGSAHAVSSVTHEGVPELVGIITQLAKTLLPAENAVALNRRQASLLGVASGALRAAATASEPIILAEHLREARDSFHRLTGRSGIEDVLDNLFGRFCLGK